MRARAGQIVDQILSEATLSRVWQHLTKGEGFGILSAYRGKDLAKDKSSTQALKSDLKKAGLGFFVVDGYWTGDKGKQEKEESVFVPGRGKKDIVSIIRKLGKKYGQEGVIAQAPGEKDVTLYMGSKTVKLGAWKPNKIADSYTKMRGRGERSFVFENIQMPINVFSAIHVYHSLGQLFDGEAFSKRYERSK